MNLLLMLRLFDRFLALLLWSSSSSEVYEALDDTESLCLFLSGSARLLEGSLGIEEGSCVVSFPLGPTDCSGRPGGERDLDIFVEIVETDEEDRLRLALPPSISSLSRSRFLPLSSSILANCSSATPFLHCC